MSTPSRDRRGERKERKRAVRPLRPTPRGWRGRGGGQSRYVQPSDEWRGTTVQVCGLWPYAAGAGAPMMGVPLGRHVFTDAAVCCDPISWFQRANLISNPSAMVLARPGFGKSTMVGHMATGLAGYGVMPLVLGDLKPDYVELIKALGGQVIRIGRDIGGLNVLDPGESVEAEQRLRAAGHRQAADEVVADAHGRRQTMVSALLTIVRGTPPSDREEAIIHRALTVLDERHEGVPVLDDLLGVIAQAPQEVRAVALDRGDDARYREITEHLEASLIGLTGGGPLGDTFARPTETPMRRDSPVVYDVSTIPDTETSLQAAALLACWSAGFGTVNVSHALADVGLEPRRHYFVILDELWRALRAGRGMVDRVDGLTRLNRTRGVGLAMVSHTISDLLSLSHEEDRMKARGFVERAGLVICGGLPSAEMPKLRSAVPLSDKEEDLLVGWSQPGAWNSAAGREEPPPGQGKFLLKVGGRPGVPVKVQLTPIEKTLANSNRRWLDQSRIGLTSSKGGTQP